jgi:hypothetical protein
MVTMPLQAPSRRACAVCLCLAGAELVEYLGEAVRLLHGCAMTAAVDDLDRGVRNPACHAVGEPPAEWRALAADQEAAQLRWSRAGLEPRRNVPPSAASP